MTIYDYQTCDAAEHAAVVEYNSVATNHFVKEASIFFDAKKCVWVVRVDDYDKWFRCYCAGSDNPEAQTP
jgi:hypothetical protein